MIAFEDIRTYYSGRDIVEDFSRALSRPAAGTHTREPERRLRREVRSGKRVGGSFGFRQSISISRSRSISRFDVADGIAPPGALHIVRQWRGSFGNPLGSCTCAGGIGLRNRGAAQRRGPMLHVRS